MRSFVCSVVALTIAGFACGAAADDLVITSSKSKQGSVYSLDFSSNGQAVAFQFEMLLPKGTLANQVNLKQCLSELPGSHHGSCSVNAGKIIGFAYSDSNKLLPAGIVPVGKVVIGGNAKGLKVSQFLVSDANAKPVESSVVSDDVVTK